MKTSENIRFRVVLGQGLLVDISDKSNRIIKLNKTASYVWEGVSTGKTVEQIAEDITNEFDVPNDTVLKDIDSFIAQLKEQGFLED